MRLVGVTSLMQRFLGPSPCCLDAFGLASPIQGVPRPPLRHLQTFRLAGTVDCRTCLLLDCLHVL